MAVAYDPSAHHQIRSRAREWDGDPDTIGALGSSGGGHVIELVA